MATNRTPIRRPPRFRITPEILAAYRHARQLHEEADIERWEAEGGQRRAYLDAHLQLHVLLGRQPWQYNVIDTADCGEPPAWMRHDRAGDWQEARAILLELEQTAQRQRIMVVG